MTTTPKPREFDADAALNEAESRLMSPTIFAKGAVWQFNQDSAEIEKLKAEIENLKHDVERLRNE